MRHAFCHERVTRFVIFNWLPRNQDGVFVCEGRIRNVEVGLVSAAFNLASYSSKSHDRMTNILLTYSGLRCIVIKYFVAASNTAAVFYINHLLAKTK